MSFSRRTQRREWDRRVRKTRSHDATQSDASADEEIVVRRQRLSDVRLELEAARVQVFDVFNEVNSDEEFDISCKHEDSTPG